MGGTIANAAQLDMSQSQLEIDNRALSQQAATEGMVLLENLNNAMPVAKGNIAVYGPGATLTVKGGTGSGAVNNRLVSYPGTTYNNCETEATPGTATQASAGECYYSVNILAGLEGAGYTITTPTPYLDYLLGITPPSGALTYANDERVLVSSGGADPATTCTRATNGTRTCTTAAGTFNVAPSAPTNTALYVVSRNSGEGSDRSATAGDYFLTANETADIELIGQTFNNVIVVLNTGGVMDTNFFRDINASFHDPSGNQAVDGLFLMSEAGEAGGAAFAQVLSGEVSPSGKTVDTWASDYKYYPAHVTFGNNDGTTVNEPYSEGIFVGYRYFDSFYKSLEPTAPESVVDYPFGYGLSYTTFSINTSSVVVTGSKVTVTAVVTNTGTAPGKQVVEVYYSAPAGDNGIDKPYQELGGYAKTDVLQPGQCQILTITYNTPDMASYSEADAAWIMDNGDYIIRVGDSSRNTKVAAVVSLGADVTSEQLHNEGLQDPAYVHEDLSGNRDDFYTYPTEAAEIAAAEKITLDPASVPRVNNASPYEQNVPVDPTVDPAHWVLGAPQSQVANQYNATTAGPNASAQPDLISSVTAYINQTAGWDTNWQGTGAPYPIKTGEQEQLLQVPDNATLWDVYNGTITMQQFVASLTAVQLGQLVEGESANVHAQEESAVGAAGYTSYIYPDLGIPGMILSDGPAGLRDTREIPAASSASGNLEYQYMTAWPIGTLLAQTWNRPLIEQCGNALGQEMVKYGVSLWLAPGMNIHRDPLNGRNFEYYSEDPLVAGLSAAAMTTGVQSNPGVGVTLKHYFANNQEASRSTENGQISERAEREIYQRGFEIAVKSAQPMAVMTSYNRVNGIYSSANYDSITDVLRGEWGFKGLVMTDWGGSHGAVYSMYSGNDLIESGGNPNEVINSMITYNPSFDVNGLPVLVTSVNAAGRSSYAWQFNGFTATIANPPAGSAQETITRTVNAAAIANQPLSYTAVTDSINNVTETPHPMYASVDAAYRELMTLTAHTTTGSNTYGLTQAQQGAITIRCTVGGSTNDCTTAADEPTGTVTAYTVTYTGYTAASHTMRLGDVQRSAMHILNVVMQSHVFGELSEARGVSGVEILPYTPNQTLVPFLTTSASEPISAVAPAVTFATDHNPNDNGWYNSNVTVTVSVADPSYTLTVNNAAYTAPIVVSNDGTTTLTAVAKCDCGVESDPATETIKLDKTAPVVTYATDGYNLLPTAADGTSGVASIEYSLNGTTWNTVANGTVSFDSASGRPVVLLRATDLAGNVSSAITVPGAGPSSSASPTTGPTSSTSPTTGPTSSTSPTTGPTSSTSPTTGPTSSTSPTTGPTSSTSPTTGPTSSTSPTTGPTSSTSPTTGPTSSQPTTGPTSSQPTTGPTSSQPTTGPTSSQPTTGPTSSQPTTGPTSSQPTTGPTSVAPTSGPSTSGTAIKTGGSATPSDSTPLLGFGLMVIVGAVATVFIVRRVRQH